MTSERMGTVDTDELVAWLREQLDEDAAHARKDIWALDRATSQGAWRARFGTGVPSELRAGDDVVAVLSADLHEADVLLAGRMVKLARQRAERLLAEVEAKRRILDAVLPPERPWEAPWDGCGDDCEWKAIEWAVLVLAQPYAGRPGFRDEWRLGDA